MGHIPRTAALGQRSRGQLHDATRGEGIALGVLDVVAEDGCASGKSMGGEDIAALAFRCFGILEFQWEGEFSVPKALAEQEICLT